MEVFFIIESAKAELFGTLLDETLTDAIYGNHTCNSIRCINRGGVISWLKITGFAFTYNLPVCKYAI